MTGELFCQFAQAGEAVGSQLAEDAWQHLGELLVLRVAGDGEGVGGQGRLHFGVVEVDHGAVVLNHIHLGVDQCHYIAIVIRVSSEISAWMLDIVIWH